jgi:hypothetical protein
MKDTPDGSQHLHPRGDENGLIKGIHEGTPNPNPSEEEIERSTEKVFTSLLDSFAVNDLTKKVLDRRERRKELGYYWGFTTTALSKLPSLAIHEPFWVDALH